MKQAVKLPFIIKSGIINYVDEEDVAVTGEGGTENVGEIFVDLESRKVFIIILDESGSMGGYDIDQCRKLAITLGETLNHIHVPFTITGVILNLSLNRLFIILNLGKIISTCSNKLS